MGAIVIDARGAAGPLLRGWGRYALQLVSALGAQASPELPIVAVTRRRAAGFLGPLVRAAACSAQRIICPSRFTAADLCRRYGVDAGRSG